MNRLCAAMTAAMALCITAPASAQQSLWDLDVGAADGPSLAVVPAADRWTGQVQVFLCTGGGPCEQTPAPIASNGAVDLTAIAAGDVVEARWSENEQVVKTLRTPAWNGPYVVTQAPAVTGVPAVGGTLSTAAAQASGGWGSPWRWTTGTSLIVCPSPEATECQQIGYGANEVVVNKRWAGWYAFAVSSWGSGHRASTDPVAVHAASPPLPHPAVLPHPGPQLAVSAPVGPMATNTASIRSRALRRNHGLSVAKVSCPLRCSVQLTVRGGGKTLRRTLQVTGLQALKIPPRHGKLDVRVVVDDKTLARGIARAR